LTTMIVGSRATPARCGKSRTGVPPGKTCYQPCRPT
jgi:hypothetical protein